MVKLRKGGTIDRDELLRKLVDMQYARNDLSFTRGTFRVRGDIIEVIPVYEEIAVRIEMFGDEIERLMTLHPLTGEVISEDEELYVFPATHFVAAAGAHGAGDRRHRGRAGRAARGAGAGGQAARGAAAADAHHATTSRCCARSATARGSRTTRGTIDGREPGSPPNTLLDFFPEDFLLVIDESHVTVPQIRGMFAGDVSRKRTLVEHGFRLPSAIDNRPLDLGRVRRPDRPDGVPVGHPGAVRAAARCGGEVVEQVIRPTGLIDPQVIIKPTKGQIDDLVHEIRERAERSSGCWSPR